jgi:hypothetical protein
MAFVIGVFPYIGWQALQALVKIPLQFAVPSLRQQYPLSDLDGLNVWYESRLLEEGIEDLQNLATANMVDVMLNTRIPVERLVDWVDQSILYLHLGPGAGKGKTERETLRRFGIRTATDLENAVLKDTDRGPASGDQIKQMARLLNFKDTEPSVLASVLATFSDEPNLYHVREWKAFPAQFLRGVLSVRPATASRECTPARGEVPYGLVPTRLRESVDDGVTPQLASNP